MDEPPSPGTADEPASEPRGRGTTDAAGTVLRTTETVTSVRDGIVAESTEIPAWVAAPWPCGLGANCAPDCVALAFPLTAAARGNGFAREPCGRKSALLIVPPAVPPAEGRASAKGERCALNPGGPSLSAAAITAPDVTDADAATEATTAARRLRRERSISRLRARLRA